MKQMHIYLVKNSCAKIFPRHNRLIIYLFFRRSDFNIAFLTHWISCFFFSASKLDSVRGTEMEKKVKEATSNENWGTSNTLLRDVARGTFD